MSAAAGGGGGGMGGGGGDGGGDGGGEARLQELSSVFCYAYDDQGRPFVLLGERADGMGWETMRAEKREQPGTTNAAPEPNRWETAARAARECTVGALDARAAGIMECPSHTLRVVDPASGRLQQVHETFFIHIEASVAEKISKCVNERPRAPVGGGAMTTPTKEEMCAFLWVPVNDIWVALFEAGETHLHVSTWGGIFYSIHLYRSFFDVMQVERIKNLLQIIIQGRGILGTHREATHVDSTDTMYRMELPTSSAVGPGRGAPDVPLTGITSDMESASRLHMTHGQAVTADPHLSEDERKREHDASMTDTVVGSGSGCGDSTVAGRSAMMAPSPRAPQGGAPTPFHSTYMLGRLGTRGPVTVQRISALTEIDAQNYNSSDLFLFDGDKVLFQKREAGSTTVGMTADASSSGGAAADGSWAEGDDDGGPLGPISGGGTPLQLLDRFTPRLVAALQARGVRCFVFTSRSYKPDRPVEDQLPTRLEQLGLSFPRSFRDTDPVELPLKPQRKAQKFDSGIIHSSSDWDLKGGVLTVFMHQWVHSGGPLPGRVFMVDDKEKHVVSVAQALFAMDIPGTVYQIDTPSGVPPSLQPAISVPNFILAQQQELRRQQQVQQSMSAAYAPATSSAAATAAATATSNSVPVPVDEENAAVAAGAAAAAAVTAAGPGRGGRSTEGSTPAAPMVQER